MKKFSSIFLLILLFCCVILSHNTFAVTLSPCGPSGGYKGASFSGDRYIKGKDQLEVAEVLVWHGNLIDAIQVIYRDKNGQEFKGPRFGGGGGHPYSFRLDPGEYIVGIQGRYGSVVDNIRFITNRGRESIRLGGAGGERGYSYYAPPSGKIIAFFGASGKLIDAIGVWIRY